jgi:hypothetical protein
VLLAVRDKVMEPENLPRLPAMVESILSYTVTDLAKSDIAALTCLATKVDTDEGMTTFVISPDMITATSTTRGSYIMLPNREKIDVLIQQFLGEHE